MQNMLKSAASKVMWVGRATVFLVGLSVILALVFGAVSAVSAHTGDKRFLHLGHKNISGAVSKLVGKVAGPSLVIGNGSEDRRATALRLNVKAGKAPIKVNAAAGKAKNLNADKVDGQSFTCPSGTLFHEGVCIEVARRASQQTHSSAQRDCLDEGKRLPAVEELQTFRNRSGHDFVDSGEWSAQLEFRGTTSGGISVSPSGTLGWGSSQAITYYRCVQPAS